ncbi:MAG: hypothetical protein P4L53_01885 [Candidatus Obscuribacterales bacterium]|nr:hypothetical protein [Candidatus Obscuribacterales bacterium]
MSQSSLSKSPRTTAENGLVAVNSGDQPSAPAQLNLLELGLHYGGDLLRGGKDSMLQPLTGAKSLLGEQHPLTSSGVPDKTGPKSIAYQAGAMVGQAIDFGIVQAVSHKIPFIKALGRTGAAMSTGFTMSFLSVQSHDSNRSADNSLKTRFMAGLEGAATIGIMEGGGKVLGKLGVADTLTGRLAKSTISGAVAGAFSTQVESKLTTGHFASLQDTALAAASWGLTGAAFASAPAFASGIKSKFTANKIGLNEKALFSSAHEPVIEPIAIEPAPRPVINLEINQEPVSTVQILPKRPADRPQIEIEWHDPGEEPTKPFDTNLQAQIEANHPHLSDQLKIHLQEAAEAISLKLTPHKPIAAADLIGANFDAHAFASIYERLHADSENYHVLSVSKELWLAEPALRIAKVFGNDWPTWLLEQERFKSKGFNLPVKPDEETLNLTGIVRTAKSLPLMSDAEQKQALLLKHFLLESPGQNSVNLKEISAAFRSNPEGATFLLGKDAATTRGALKALQSLPDIPVPLAVKYAHEPYTRQLAALAAWKKLAPQLTVEETQLFATSDLKHNSVSTQDRFLAYLHSAEASGTHHLLQETNLTPAVVAELHPALSEEQATLIARVANQLATADKRNGSLYQQTPFELVSGGFQPETYLAARQQLSENQSRNITMTSLWDRDEKAFQLVNTFGENWNTFVNQREESLASSLYTRDQFFSELRLPMKTTDETKPLADFLLRNNSMSIQETLSLLERLKKSSDASFNEIFSATDQEIVQASRSWMLAPDLPFALAAHFGDKKTIETTAAALTYFEQIETPPSNLANLDALKIDSPHFEDFWEKYPETLAKGKHALIAESNSVRAAIGAFHPNLSERHKLALERAAMDTDAPLKFVAADTKAGTFAKVFDRFAASSGQEDGDWQGRSALATTNIFGRNALAWLDKQQRRGLDLHDATRGLPVYSPQEASGLGDFLNSQGQRKTRELSLIAKRWTELPDEVRKLPFSKIITKLRDQAYENVESPALSKEAFAWDVSAQDYARDEPRFLKSLDTPSPFPLEKVWNEEGLTGRFLPRSDPRGLYLGEHTNCCQHPGEAGSSCAWFGQESALSGFFVVENKAKEIVAQSWAWISDQGGLVFDSLEAKGLGKRADAVSKIYQKAATDLSENFSTVTLGKGTNRVDLSQWPEAEANTQALPIAYGNKYTDARQQVLLAANSSAKGFSEQPNLVQDHSQGTGLTTNRTLLSTNGRQPMAVRLTDLSSDIFAAENVAEKVYPQDYRYVSDGDSLLVLDASGHGPVGYASIDLAAHEITDLAVLEKFRPHSRLLLKGVYDFLRTNQNQPGQIWNAELRQSTSDRLVNYYEQKGLLTVLSRRQVDTMHGEPMYNVRFTLN